MDLKRRLARFETLVEAEAPAPTYWTPARIEGYRIWAERLLDSMPFDRARAVFEELVTLPAEAWGPVARRLDHMARMGADGGYDSDGWPYWTERAIELPGPVCEALERHPDAGYVWDFSCEACGLELPHRTGVAQATAALFDTCPLCDGQAKHCGYTHRRYREAWQRQKAEMATIAGDGAA